MATFKSDYAFGMNHEEKNTELLSKVFKKPLIRRGGCATFDYDDGGLLSVELKSRRIRHDAYPTTLIGLNKVEWAASNPTRQCWFCWNYVDGVYGLAYDKDLFDTFSVTEYSRGDRPDYHNRPQKVVWIPREHLTKLL